MAKCSEKWCEKDAVVRGMCDMHYRRRRRKGEFVGTTKVCSIKNCTDRVVANNLCDRHRQRLRSHGDTGLRRPDDWGEIGKHPLYHTYQWAKRVGIDDRWKDFWVFAADVGERPEGHKLHRYDRDEPFSKDNCFWKIGAAPGIANVKYQRKYRRNHPHANKDNELRNRFGLESGIDDYHAMLEAQGGGCAICGCKQDPTYKYFPVDHDHETGKVRGLLCSMCNKALGGFKDNLDFLQKAVDYLRSPPANDVLEKQRHE